VVHTLWFVHFTNVHLTYCAAAIARNIYLYPGTGVGALRHRYGGPKRPGRSVKPQHHCQGSAAIARRCLQALEKLGLVKKDPKHG
jgi:small subunit ribosomal protein S19e